MNLVKPINVNQQHRVVAVTADCIRRAGKFFDQSFEVIPIVFDLKGRAAGMYKRSNKHRVIRYNPYIFAKYFDDNLAVTVPHEVAHYVTDRLYGLRHIRPHGREWQQVMNSLGADARRTCSYDLDGVPQRVHKRYTYDCGCTTHELSSRRHNWVRRGASQYFCRKCGNELALAGNV